MRLDLLWNPLDRGDERKSAMEFSSASRKHGRVKPR